MAESLLRVHAHGWTPLKDTVDFIVWSRREFNTAADHALNAAMDVGKDWANIQQDDLVDALRQKNNLRLCVDGGRRTEKLGETGYALFAACRGEDGKYNYRLLATQGRLLDGVSSAFVAEALALEWALQHLLSFMRYGI